LRNYPVLSWSRNSPHFMEPEGSLPHSQVSTTCPYPKPDQSTRYSTSRFLKIHFNIILPSTSSNVFQTVSFPQVSPPKPRMHLFFPDAFQSLANLILLYFITRDSVSSTDHKTPRYVVFSVLSVADPMRNVSYMLFPGRTELVTLVKTGSMAGRTHSQ